MMNDKLILVGVITSAHGIKGDVVIRSFIRPITDITTSQLLNENREIIRLKLLRIKNDKNLICKLDIINDRTEAEKYKGYKLYHLRSMLSPLDEDEFYVSDLIGMRVVNKEQIPLGVITNIFNFGAGDIIEIKFKDGTIELLPFLKVLFPEITNEYIVYTSFV